MEHSRTNRDTPAPTVSPFLERDGDEPPDRLGAGGQVILGAAPIVQVPAHLFRQADGGHGVLTGSRSARTFPYYVFACLRHEKRTTLFCLERQAARHGVRAPERA